MSALFVMILRKMRKNVWLEAGLACGLVLSVALVSSIPLYAGAVSQKMLSEELAQKQQQTGVFSGLFEVSSVLLSATPYEDIQALDLRMGEAFSQFSIPSLHRVTVRESERLRVVPAEGSGLDPGVERWGKLGAMSGLETEIELIAGRLPAAGAADGRRSETIVFESLLTELRVELGSVLNFTDETTGRSVPAEIVGVFRNKSSYYWQNNLGTYSNTFFLRFEDFENGVRDGRLPGIRYSSWYEILDYTKMSSADIASYNRVHRDAVRITQSTKAMAIPQIRAVAQESIEAYIVKERQLGVMMWSLNTPIIAMLLIYLYMASHLIVDRQKAEIAVIRSRGASRTQVILSYVFELGVLGGIAMLAGPPLGALFAKALGASNGFLEFVQRTGLKVALDREVYAYAAVGVLSALVMTLLPAVAAARVSIVGQKRQAARAERPMLWHRLYLDLVLMALSGYGLYAFRERLANMRALAADASQLSVDPILFAVPSLFAIGFGLFMLRLYPLFIRLLFRAGKSFWPPSLYASLVQIGRSGSQYQFFMLFLIITVSTGMFGAAAARTINQNYEDKIRYEHGADLVVQTLWGSNLLVPVIPGGPPTTPNGEPVQYKEPPFEPFKTLSQAASAAKVFRKASADIYVDGGKASAVLMGIDTDQFGRTAWFRRDLMNRHLNEYLNLIAKEPRAVLVSRSIAEEYGVQPGDTLEVGWMYVEAKPFIVYGVVDYFPTFNPNPQPSSRSGKPVTPHLVVGHLWAIQSALGVEPYDVWIKLEEGADRAALFADMEEKGIRVMSSADTEQAIIQVKNDPIMLGINGTMSLGFLVALTISFFGFLLYWVLSLRKRVLQIGVFRALGLTLKQLYGMLAAEQLLTSGAAIVLGAVSGTAVTSLFVPFFQLSFDSSTLVPPFRIAVASQDLLLLNGFVGITIVTGLFVLGSMLSNIKIHQALKLGED